MKKHFLILLLYWLCLAGYSQQNINLSAGKWSEDIDFFVAQVKKVVPDSDDRIDQKEFDQKVRQLKSRLASYSTDQIILGLQELLTMTGDNGCTIYPFQEALNYPVLPIKTYWFGDGLYICDASDPYKAIVGQKLTAIGGVEVDRLFRQMHKVLPGDNDHSKKRSFSLYAQIPAWLQTTEAAFTPEAIALSFASGKKETVQFGNVKEYIGLKRQLAGFRQLNPTSKKHEKDNYWMEYLPDKRLLFIQFINIRDNDRGPSFRQFVNAIEKTLDSNPIDKVVIDNRYGGGGNGFKLKPLTDLLQKHPKVSQKGQLFVLTSRATRGTVMELTSLLELNTKAIIVGEPTGEGPNSVGDTRSIALPHSKVKVTLTHKFWPTSWKEDRRNSIQPHISVDYPFIEYNDKTDPWLDKVRAGKIPESRYSAIPENVVKGIAGKHKVNGREITIYENNGQLFGLINRKIKSFFEFHTQLYYDQEGILSTDIDDVLIRYDISTGRKVKLTQVRWKGVELMKAP